MYIYTPRVHGYVYSNNTKSADTGEFEPKRGYS